MSTPSSDALSPLKRAIVEIRELKARLADAEQRASEPVAVVGLGLRFPGGADDPESFWQLLWDGVDAIGEVPAERWPVDALYDADPDVPGKMNTRWGGFIADIDQFDAPFFGLSRREAESMDPQQRMLLEVTWEALEHAGIPADDLFGSNTGVFLGIANSDYMRLLLADRDRIDTYTTTGNALSIAAGRLSYVLGAQGPAIALDTACSSSLVAVHLAVQSLRHRECDLALAGGVNLILTPELTINFSQARMMAPDGRCKTFDAAADGYVRSEGCGLVVLKRLSDARAHGDHVLAVIRGSAVNQDGRSGGLTAPNGPSQEHVVAAALADAGARPSDVSYVEAHGTGTLLGDPIEVGALGSVLCRDRPASAPLLVGSVKTNIGHTETAAGIAGLIKVVLMQQHAAIPPHLHLHELNPHIAAAGFPIAVPTTATAWPTDAGDRLAGVSSFGLSGTNAHVVVGACPARSAGADITPARPANVLTLSARSEAALRALAGRYAGHLAARPELPLAEVSFSANTGRSHLAQRLAVVAADTVEAARQLAGFAGGEPATAELITSVGSVAPAGGGLAFLFTGHGSHYAGMGRRLYADEPVFAAAIDRCDDLLRGELDRRLADILFGDGDLLDHMVYAQPALFSLQYALAELWASWGVRPAVVAGHSAGEYVAAVVAGVLSLADGLRVISARGRLMESLDDGGAMAALFLDETTVAEALAGREADVSIAAVNGPFTTVISGRRTAVQDVIADLGLDGDDWRALDVSIAAHSPLVEPILDEFGGVVAGAALQRPAIGLVSSMTGRFVADELTDVGYWQRHLRAPVRFADVFATLRDGGCTTFVEIGPHPTLLGLGRRNWPDAAATWVPSMVRDGDESLEMARALATVYVAGEDVDWRAFDGRGTSLPIARPRIDLPTYPWQHQSYWSAQAVASDRAPRVPMWGAAVAAATAQADQGPLDLSVETYPRRWRLLDRLAGLYTVRALRDLGLFADAGESHTVHDLFAAGRFVAGYEHLVTRWLTHLADDGLLVHDGDEFVARRALPAAEDDLTATLAEARLAFEGIEPLLDYVVRCGDRLSAVLGGQESALSTLFPDGSYDTVDFIYGGWAVPRYFNAIVRAAATAAATARGGRPLRILEIGAGTGGTTATVLPALPATATSYTFTDVSDFFLTRAAERFADHPFVRYARLDIEQAPESQGYEPGSYDVVVAANVLHATRDLDVTLDHVCSLLAPGGMLLAFESTEHPRWFDVTTGLIEGWQAFEDSWRSDVPLIDTKKWTEALLSAGFSAVVPLPGDGAPTATLLQHVVLARAPGEEVTAALTADLDGAGLPAPIPVTARLVAEDVAARLADALPDERHEVLVDVVRQAVAHVLRVADPATLRRDLPLLDLGFDSLMAVELRNVLRQSLTLDCKLPATLVFDHPTIAAVASYLELVLRGDAPALDAAGTDPRLASVRTSPTLEAAAVAELSEDEVEAMLLSKLAEIEQ